MLHVNKRATSVSWVLSIVVSFFALIAVHVSADDEISFLPVEEAYVVSLSKNEGVVSFRWNIAEGYYLYANKISAKAMDAGQFVNLPLSIPKGKKKFDPNFNEELEVHYTTLNVTSSDAVSDSVKYFSLRSQGCADAGLCYPPRTQYFSQNGSTFVELTKDTFNALTEKLVTTDVNTVAEAEKPFLLWMMLGAILGGFILNLMPCVFPVLSLKALSLAHGDAATHHRNGWAYTAGVVLSFLLVAVVIIVAKSTGESLGWGFQLQQPLFVCALVYLFVLLGLNLSGYFEMGTSMMGIGNDLTQGDSASASFFTGVLAAVVASPCTAPFMATAVGFAVTQSAVSALLVFACLGLGLAAPYLLLAYLPGVANRMPSPGPWMDRLKQLLAFPMFLTSAWLLGVLGNQTSAKTASIVVMGIIAITFAIWLLQGQKTPRSRWISRGLALSAAFTAGWIALNIEKIDSKEGSPWLEYSEQTIASLQSENRAIFVDLTADWCITCKMNENVAIEREAVHAFAKENNIALVKGDWTKNDPKITEYLASFGRNGVPLYVMYSRKPGEEPKILPQILTEKSVLNAMKNAL